MIKVSLKFRQEKQAFTSSFRLKVRGRRARRFGQKGKAISCSLMSSKMNFSRRIRKLVRCVGTAANCGYTCPRARSRLLRTPIQTYIILYIYTAAQHSRARLATSPALGSASICQFPVSNKMDGWRMEIMVETRPHTPETFRSVCTCTCEGEREMCTKGKREREEEREGRQSPSILFGTTLIPRDPPPPRYSALRSRIIPFRVFCALKYKYVGERRSLRPRSSDFFFNSRTKRCSAIFFRGF